MIASLRGVVGGRSGNSVVVDVGGVGYLVQVSTMTLDAMGSMGEPVSVLVHTQVREDAITLYGFGDADERSVFLMLLGVQGVGPRTALAVLSCLRPGDVLDAIVSGDAKALGAADGVGPRTATRIVSELRGKAAVSGGRSGDLVLRGFEGGRAVEEARQGLSALGFHKIEANQILSTVMNGPDAPKDVASILSACLRSSTVRAA